MGLDKAGNGINIVAVASTPGIWETFQIVRKSDDVNRVRIQASNGFFLQVCAGISYLFQSIQEVNCRLMTATIRRLIFYYIAEAFY